MPQDLRKATLFIAISLAATLASITLSSITKPNTSQAVPSSVITLFSKWKARYGVTYLTPAEYAFRLTIFSKNRELLDLYRDLNPEATYNLNVFSDRTEEELNKWL